MKLIIDINEKDYKFIKQHCILKGHFPMGWKEIAGGKPLQTELENIKVEIDRLYGCYNQYFKERLVIKSYVMQILNNHISESKGENK